MATNNAINSNIPIEVTKGGTGAASLTDHGVLVGSGTAAVDALAVGTTGQLLVGVTGADPAFDSTASADFTFTTATAGATRVLNITNTDNTNASSNARVNIQTGGSSAGDPNIQFNIAGINNYVMGIDNSDSDRFKISYGGTLGTNDIMATRTSGEINYPLQPAFLAYLLTTDADVTGDGTSFTLGSVTALTEIFDQNSDFNTNGTFTAPVTGRYLLCADVYFGTIGVATGAQLQINTSNRNYAFNAINPSAAAHVSFADIGLHGSVLVDMDGSDTATVVVQATGTTKTVDVIGSGTLVSSFSGFLAC